MHIITYFLYGKTYIFFSYHIIKSKSFIFQWINPKRIAFSLSKWWIASAIENTDAGDDSDSLAVKYVHGKKIDKYSVFRVESEMCSSKMGKIRKKLFNKFNVFFVPIKMEFMTDLYGCLIDILHIHDYYYYWIEC